MTRLPIQVPHTMPAATNPGMPQTRPIRISQPRSTPSRPAERDRSGMRRQERVGHRQAGQHRQGVQHQRLAAAHGRDVHQRREHEDADVEEDRDAEIRPSRPIAIGRAASRRTGHEPLVSTSAPPDRSRIAPSTVPRPMITAMCPRMPPKPVSSRESLALGAVPTSSLT